MFASQSIHQARVKSQTKAHALFAAVVIATLASTAANAHIKDEPESIRSVLGFDVDGVELDEVTASPTTFQLYTHAQRSVISFRIRDAVYLYSIAGDNHRTEARSLLASLRERRGIRAVVDVKPFRSEKFAQFFYVRAFRVTLGLEN